MKEALSLKCYEVIPEVVVDDKTTLDGGGDGVLPSVAPFTNMEINFNANLDK